MSVQLKDAALLLRDKFRNRATSEQPTLWASMAEAPARAGRFPDPPEREHYRNEGGWHYPPITAFLHSPPGKIRRLYLKSTAMKSVLGEPSGEYAEQLMIKIASGLAAEWEWFREEFAHEAGRLLPGKANEIEGYHADRWAVRLFVEQEQHPLTPGGLLADGFFTRWVDIYAGSALLCEKLANESPPPGGPPTEGNPRIYIENGVVMLDGKPIPILGKTPKVIERTADYIANLIEANGEPVNQPENFKSDQMPNQLDAVFVCDNQFEGYKLAKEYRRN